MKIFYVLIHHLLATASEANELPHNDECICEIKIENDMKQT